MLVNKLPFHHSDSNSVSIQQRRVALNKRPPLFRSTSPTLCNVTDKGLHRTSSNASLNSSSTMNSNRIVAPPSRHHKPKKSVRFCDNASLESVRLFLKSQMPKACRSDPVCPKHYTYRLRLPNWLLTSSSRGSGSNNGRIGNAVRMETIQLENNSTTTTAVTLTGSVQVANLAFEKHVVIRYTLDDWLTFKEIDADYQEPIAHSANTWDRFRFTIKIQAPCHNTHTTLYLAVHYTVAGREFWDNNDNKNYEVDVVPDVQLQLPNDELSFSSSDEDDDENTFEDCCPVEEDVQPTIVDDDDAVKLLETKIKPLSLKDNAATNDILFHPEPRKKTDNNPSVWSPSPPLSPTTPADTSPLWIDTLSSGTTVIGSHAPTTTYFMSNGKEDTTTGHPDVMTCPTNSHQFHTLVSNYCFYAGPSTQTTLYPPCPSSPTPKAVIS